MFWFIVGLVLVVGGIVGIILATKFDRDLSSEEEMRTISFLVGGVALLVGVVTIFLNTFAVVPARNVGVVNAFGKVQGSVDNGWVWVAPWASVELVDATVKNVNLDEDTKNPVVVRLGNSTTANVDLTVQWHVDQNGNAAELWQRYRGTNNDLIGNVQENVVKRKLVPAVNRAFEKHDPLAAAIAGKDTNTTNKEMSAAILNDLRAGMDAGIVIDSVEVQFVHYDGVTQEKLNAYAQALADTRIAQQRVLTAEQVRIANEKLAAGTAVRDAGVQYQNCLNLIADLASKNQLGNLPPTFNCGGSGTPVIVGQK